MILVVCPNPSIDTYVWVDSLDPGKVHRSHKESKFPGGKGVHVALAAAELGEDVVLLGFWGGPSGDWLINECNQKGVQCVGPKTKEWTRSCITFKSNDIYDDTELLGCGPAISDDDYNLFLNTFKKYIKKAKVVTMSGSWPAGSPSDGYAKLIKIANNNKIPSFLDCTGEAFLNGIKEQPFAIHLNQSESQNVSGNFKIKDILSWFANHKIIAAITAGEDGLYLKNGGKNIHGVVKISNVYSAVGSGDCLTAGLAVAFANNYSEEEVVKVAVACGAANCLRQDLGLLYKKDVIELKDKVKIKYL